MQSNNVYKKVEHQKLEAQIETVQLNEEYTSATTPASSVSTAQKKQTTAAIDNSSRTDEPRW